MIGRIEQVLAARLALAARERAEHVEAASDGADEPTFALAVGRDGAEHRRHRLVGAVGAAEALDRDVGAPPGLEQEMDAPFVRGGETQGRVIRESGAARLGQYSDTLFTHNTNAGQGKLWN